MSTGYYFLDHCECVEERNISNGYEHTYTFTGDAKLANKSEALMQISVNVKAADLLRFKQGVAIQDAFPYIDRDTREWMLNGMYVDREASELATTNITEPEQVQPETRQFTPTGIPALFIELCDNWTARGSAEGVCIELTNAVISVPIGEHPIGTKFTAIVLWVMHIEYPHLQLIKELDADNSTLTENYNIDMLIEFSERGAKYEFLFPNDKIVNS